MYDATLSARREINTIFLIFLFMVCQGQPLGLPRDQAVPSPRPVYLISLMTASGLRVDIFSIFFMSEREKIESMFFMMPPILS